MTAVIGAPGCSGGYARDSMASSDRMSVSGVSLDADKMALTVQSSVGFDPEKATPTSQEQPGPAEVLAVKHGGAYRPISAASSDSLERMVQAALDGEPARLSDAELEKLIAELPSDFGRGHISATGSSGECMTSGLKQMNLECDRMEGGAALNLLGGLIGSNDGAYHTAINPTLGRQFDTVKGGAGPRPPRPSSRPQRKRSSVKLDTNPFINGGGVNPFTDMAENGGEAAWLSIADSSPPPDPSMQKPTQHAHTNLPVADPLPELPSEQMRTDDGGWNPSLLSLSIKDVHAFISARGLSPEDAKDLKVHRRRVMNRMYTKLSRQRRGSSSGGAKKNSGRKPPSEVKDKAAVWEYAVSLSSACQRAKKK